MLEIAEQMCAIGRRAYARQLVTATEGNFSCRLGPESVLCTPTGTCKGFLRPVDLCVVDLQGRQLSGLRRRSSEILMHLELYRADPQIRAIIHTHPPFATTFAVLQPPREGQAPAEPPMREASCREGEAPAHRVAAPTEPHPAASVVPLPRPALDLAGVLPEGDVFLGEVPVAPYRTPGTPAMAEPLVPLLRDHVAAILQNHGAVTWGPDLETAYILTETLEALCRVVFQARQIGQVGRIPAGERQALAKLRAELRARAEPGNAERRG
jgi:L-fuculose-phosphate aldolase